LKKTKQIVVLLILLLIGKSLNSQILISLIFGEKLNSPNIEFGLDGGLCSSTMEGAGAKSALRTLNLGFYFDFKLKNPSWRINTGVMVKSTVGAKGLPIYKVDNAEINTVFSSGNVTRRLNYFYVPAMLKYQFKSKIYLKAGVQMGLMHKATDLFMNTINNTDDLEFSNSISNKYKYFDAGLAAGLGYHLMSGNGMNLGIQYYYGLLNVLNDGTGAKQFNRAFFINVGIPIGAAKKKEVVGIEIGK